MSYFIQIIRNISKYVTCFERFQFVVFWNESLDAVIRELKCTRLTKCRTYVHRSLSVTHV